MPDVRSAISSNASSQPISTQPASVRFIGVRKRSPSSCSCFRVDPFGQMNPLLTGSFMSPRMRTTWSPSVVISRPQVASQRGQVR